MNYSLKISQDRNGAMPKTEQILCWQPPVSDESREDGFSNPRDHLDCHGCEHNPGDRRSDGCGRENPKKQDDDAERTLMQGGQHPAVLTPVRLPLGRLRRQREGARQNRCRPQTNTIPPQRQTLEFRVRRQFPETETMSLMNETPSFRGISSATRFRMR